MCQNWISWGSNLVTPRNARDTTDGDCIRWSSSITCSSITCSCPLGLFSCGWDGAVRSFWSPISTWGGLGACLSRLYHVDLLKHIFSCDMINNQPCLLFIAQVFELHLVHSSGMPGGGSWFSSKWRDYLVAGQRMHHITCQRLEQLPSCENPTICCSSLATSAFVVTIDSFKWKGESHLRLHLMMSMDDHVRSTMGSKMWNCCWTNHIMCRSPITRPIIWSVARALALQVSSTLDNIICLK